MYMYPCLLRQNCYRKKKKKKKTLTTEEMLTLDGLKKRLNLVLSADFQMCKLVPYWGYSAQPGSLHVGATPNQPLTNLQQWLDSIATTLCKENPLVTNNAGARIPGVFHHMRAGEHQQFLQTFTSLLCGRCSVPPICPALLVRAPFSPWSRVGQVPQQSIPHVAHSFLELPEWAL